MEERNVQTESINQEMTKAIARMVDRGESIDYSIPLPETELDVMQAVWGGESPITTSYLMQVLGSKRGWKVPTLISFLVRLENKGYVGSLKKGKERLYFPLADQRLYLQMATKRFVDRYHRGSLVSVLEALYPSGHLPDAEIDDFLGWLVPKE